MHWLSCCPAWQEQRQCPLPGLLNLLCLMLQLLGPPPVLWGLTLISCRALLEGPASRRPLPPPLLPFPLLQLSSEPLSLSDMTYQFSHLYLFSLPRQNVSSKRVQIFV